MQEHKLWFPKEAEYFEQAFPLGNGKIGAVLYGKTDTEQISLNEDTLWSGLPGQNPVPPHAKEAFHTARDLVMEGKYKEAQGLLEQQFSSSWTQVYLPLGNLLLNFGHQSPRHYRRELDLSTATATVSYEENGVGYHRSCFVSAPDNVLVMTIEADREQALSFFVSLAAKLDVSKTETEQDVWLQHGYCPSFGSAYLPEEQAFSYDKKGISFTQGIRVIADNKTVTEQGIAVENVTKATLLFSVSTSYNRESGLLDADCVSPVRRALNTNPNTLYQRHLEDYQALYCRTELNLTPKKDGRDTMTRLETFSGETGMHELLFHFGRYLTIASSREGSMATNLQGIWNEHLIPPWSSNYTVNINTEMNYWCTYPAHLEECFEPFEQLANNVMKQGAFTAGEYYDAPGIVSHHNLDLWCHTNPVGKQGSGCAVYAFWNLSSGWIGCMLYDSWLYHQNEEKLKTLIFPYLKEASRFYLSVMTEDEDGSLILAPSTSPENRFYVEGDMLAVSKWSTMSISILQDLFSAALECSQLLEDEELVPELTEALQKMKQPQIGSDGRLMEWDKEFAEQDPHHRHVSHLYGLYPGHSITKEETPELFEAVRSSLVTRGDEGTGWSLAWKLNLWAHLGDAEHALKILNMQFHLCPSDQKTVMTGGGSYPNLLGAHPPFQIDSNFGVTAGIANLLVQSRKEEIHLFPAKPSCWETGSAKGLLAYGGIVIDLTWDKDFHTAMLLSPGDTTVTVGFGAEKKEVFLKENTPCSFQWNTRE
ncbi:MAG: glycoside hydrolase family 95 protein [Ruminococcaceae bacterium]|nr:glycoside hydrolase family 95 protein [Oscillospiraceae bacterium]